MAWVHLVIAILLGALGLVIVALVPGVPRGSMIEAGSITVVLAAGVVAAVLGEHQRRQAAVPTQAASQSAESDWLRAARRDGLR